ncbi:MAG: TonB-dependent receptor plug domain-containing protein [bacterium]|nr:TonB-dependent receptor plug domain-containing protein [bacterium]
MRSSPKRARAQIIGVLLATCAMPGFAVAADAGKDNAANTDVSAVLVNAKRASTPTVTAVEAVKYGNAVQEVTAEQIRVSGASNFAELAQFLVKGVNIGYSPDEGEYTIRLDGGGDRDTLVIRDGVPLYDRGPALEDIWSSTTLDPHMIENVEVFRGGNSLFYGSNGGIGVVSIVSKKPDGTRKGDFGASYGSFQSRELWGNYSFPLDSEGKHSLMVYGSMQATDGPRIYNPKAYVDNVFAAGGHQKFPLNRNEVGVKYLWQINDTTKLRLNAEYTESWFQDAFPDGEVHSPNTVRYPIADLSLEKRWSPAFLTEVQAYYSNPHIWNSEVYPDICKDKAGCTNPSTNKKVAYGDWSGKTYANGAYRGFGDGSQYKAGFLEMGLTVRNTVDFGDYLQVVAGVQTVSYKDDSDPIYPVGDETATTTGVFLDARPKLAFSPDTAISLAVRTDVLPSSDSETIWKFGVRQPLWAGSYVRANGGTSYSLPRTTELNNDTSTTKGNPDLQAESTKTFNGALGYQRQFSDVAVSVELGAFKTEITHRIQGTTDFRVPAEGAFGPRNTYFNNEALTKILGATLDVDLAIGKAWKLNLGYTAQDASLDSGLFKGEQISETPAWFINGTLAWTSEDQRLNLTLLPRVQGSEWASGGLSVAGRPSIRKDFGHYTVVNASINYFAGKDLQHQFQLRIVNLFDEKYAERYGFGNQRFGSAFNRGEFKTTDPRYYFGYEFEGKPRAFYASYSTRF